MCKIMIIPGVKPENKDRAWALAKMARPYMTTFDRDAFGYAALGQYGIFGERWTDVRRAFKLHRDVTRAERVLNQVFETTLKERDSEYSAFGERTRNVTAMLLHSRFATCALGIANAHPFERDGHALIHNGVIENARELTNLTSQCDSETILNEYVTERVAKTPQNIKRVTERLRGWYAVGVLAPVGGGDYVLDVFKGNASLVCGFVRELDTLVFCTTETILRTAVKGCGMHIDGKIIEVPDGVMYRFNADTGELIAKFEFEVNARRVHTETALSSWMDEYYKDEPLIGWRGLQHAHAEVNGEEIDLDLARAMTAEAEALLEEHLDDVIDANEIADEDEDEDEDDVRDVVIPVDEEMRRIGTERLKTITHGELIAGQLKRDRS